MGEGLLGWATNDLVRLDDQTSGVIARVLTAGPARRQAIFMALATQGEERKFSDGLFPADLSEVVRHGRSQDILRHAFGDIPAGLPGLLERIGDRPLPRAQDYLAILQLVRRQDASALDALRGEGRITAKRLDILAALDPRWRHANTLGRLDTPSEAMRFNKAMEFVQSVSSRATDEAVALAIARLSPTSSLPRLLDKFVRRADRLPSHPISMTDDAMRPFVTMRDYLEAARRYRNCLMSKLGDVAAGRFAIAEFQQTALLEFRPLTTQAGWMLWMIHGRRNASVPLAICEAAEARCDELGIPRVSDHAGGAPWRAYRSFARQVDWE